MNNLFFFKDQNHLLRKVLKHLKYVSLIHLYNFIYSVSVFLTFTLHENKSFVGHRTELLISFLLSK